jgi:hypothetical protein
MNLPYPPENIPLEDCCRRRRPALLLAFGFEPSGANVGKPNLNGSESSLPQF